MGLFNLIFTLGANAAPFNSALRGARQNVSNFAHDIQGQFAQMFTLRAVGQFLSGVTTAVNRIKDLSEQTGISTDEVQKADFALKQSGLAFEDLSMALNKLANSRREAVEGNEELRKTFEKYGLTVRDLNDPQKRTFDVLMQISKAMGEMNPTAREQTQIMDLLGAKAGKLVNILKDLSTIAPPELFGEREIRQIDDATKAIERFKLSAQIEVGGALSRWLDFWDIVTGKHAKTEFLASMPIGQGAIKAASEAKRARMGAKGDELFKEKLTKTDWAIAMEEMLMTGAGMTMRPFMAKGKTAASTSASRFTPSTDQLVGVGNFLGGDTSVVVRTQIKSIVDRLDKIERNTKQLANNAAVIKK